MALARYRRDGGMNYWPGFVDALSTLILSIIFLLTVFMVAQFFLSQEISGKDTALQSLNAKILQLSQLLSLEQTGKTTLQDEITQLRASLTVVQGERDRLRGAAAAGPDQGGSGSDAGAANAKLDLEKQIPAEIHWVLRVDGHTDTRPLGPTSPFKSNWELSAARAISVVQYLIGKGVPPQRLVAAGFGEFQPIDPGTTDEAYSRNRRIELKLTER